MELRLGSGRTLRAQQVVYTLASTQPVLPAWAKQLAASASAGPASAGGSAEDIAQSASRLPPQVGLFCSQLLRRWLLPCALLPLLPLGNLTKS